MAFDIPTSTLKDWSSILKDGLTIIALLLGGGLALVKLRMFRLIVPNAKLSLCVQHVEHSKGYRVFVQMDVENLTGRRISMRDYKLSIVPVTAEEKPRALPGCFGSICEKLKSSCEAEEYCHRVPPEGISPKELADPQHLLTIDKGEHITLAYAHDVEFDSAKPKPIACRITAVFTSQQREWSWRRPWRQGCEYAWFKDSFYVFGSSAHHAQSTATPRGSVRGS
jgi:hypothetical protein